MAEDIESAKEAALIKASKFVAGCLTTPDQLDKVEQIRRKVLRNKAAFLLILTEVFSSVRIKRNPYFQAAVDSRLKTAVQSHIDGIRSGLKELQSAQDDIAYTRKLIDEISTIFKECEPLGGKLRSVEVCQEKYAKLEKTNSHLKLIFNVPQTIKTTEILIKDGKLLQAHKNIMELEQTRDELLLEMFEIAKADGNSEPLTKSPLYMYFSEVEKLSEELCKQILMIIVRTLQAAKQTPTELVTSLRIIEREERFDQEDAKVVDLADKMWLVKELERMRMFILDDLMTVKHLVRPCFPPSYNIFKEYVVLYHGATSVSLEKYAKKESSNKSNECVTLLQWINEYDGPDLLGHEELKEYIEDFKDELEPILSHGVVESLTDIYVTTTEKNIHTWLENMCATETQDWHQEKLPEADAEGYFQTSLPIILFQMLDQNTTSKSENKNLQVGAFIEKEVKMKILDICIKAMESFITTYQNAIISYKQKHYENRAANQFFEPYMYFFDVLALRLSYEEKVSISNNCLMIAEFSEQMKSQLRADLGEETFGLHRVDYFKRVIRGFGVLAENVCDLLLDGVFLDLDQYFQELMTRKWLGSGTIIDTVIATLEDYGNDYTHLKPRCFKYIMEKAENRVVTEYVRAALSRRITFRNSEERIEGANQITEEAKKICNMFINLAAMPEFEKSTSYILAAIAEVLRIQNTEIISLEVVGLANKYKDFRADHALAILAVRGDMGRPECLQLTSDLKIREADESSPEERTKGIFVKVTPAGSILESLESRFKR